MDEIKLTSSAIRRIKEVMEQEGLKDHYLRVGIIGGGCGGLQYNLDFTEKAQEYDIIFNYDNIKIAIDEISFTHLHGTEIDYVDNSMETGFKFNNQNAQDKSCGCGASSGCGEEY